MEEATEYKKYLEALRKATEEVKEDKEKQKPIKPKQMSCGGMGIAIKAEILKE